MPSPGLASIVENVNACKTRTYEVMQLLTAHCSALYHAEMLKDKHTMMILTYQDVQIL